MYAQDNQGYCPPGADDLYTTNLHRWHGSRLSSVLGTPASRFTFDGNPGSPLRPYLQNGAVKACPTFMDLVTDGAETNSGGYGYNGDYIGSSTADSAAANNYQVPAKLTQIQRPAEKICFADVATTVYYDSGGNPVTGLFEESFVYPPVAFYWWGAPPTQGTWNYNPSMHFRHRNREASVAWLDGHVTSEPFGWSYPGSDFEKANIGWMLPANDTKNVLFRRD
jgi:prepilin-type processing-associated H-X9-DG protein